MKYIGRYGEYLVLLKLLERNVESYLAIKSNQEDYDITVVLGSSCVKRVQVKSTKLQNKSTNNSFSGTEKDYDYLVLVILDSNLPRCFILTKAEADKECSNSKKLACSQKINCEYIVKDSLIQYEEQWCKITNEITKGAT